MSENVNDSVIIAQMDKVSPLAAKKKKKKIVSIDSSFVGHSSKSEIESGSTIEWVYVDAGIILNI